MGARASWQWGVGAVLLLTVATLAALQAGKTALASALTGALGVVSIASLVVVHARHRESAETSQKHLQERLDQARAGLANANAMMQAAFDSYPIATALVWDGRIEFSNKAAVATGLLPGSAADEMPGWFKSLASTQGSDGDGKRESVRMMINGQERYFSPRTVTVRDAGGASRGMLITLGDVTQSAAAGETGAKFVSSFSHELRTPLTSIQMTIHLLLEDVGRMTPRQVEFLQAARDDAHRLQALIEEMVAAVRARLSRRSTKSRSLSRLRASSSASR